MTEIVKHSLAENEAVIRRSLTDFIEVGHALMEIRDERQYVAAGFDTFENYCRERWDFARSTANDHINSVRVVDVVSARANIAPPQTEFQARPLIKVLNQDGEDAVTQAWEQIVERHGGDVPGRQVRRFLTFGEGANYGKPGWHELIGQVGDDLTKAEKDLAKFEEAIGDRRQKDPMRDKAAEYSERAEGIAHRLRLIADTGRRGG